MAHITESFTITPSDVIRVADPSGADYPWVDQDHLVKAAKKGIFIHRRTGLELSHFLPNSHPLKSHIYDYAPPLSLESPQSSQISNNTTLWAKIDILAGPPEHRLCLEIKPGGRGPSGGIKGRHILQVTLNSLSLSDPQTPDLSVYLYNSGVLFSIPTSVRQDLDSLSLTLARSAANILFLQRQVDQFTKILSIKKRTKTGQNYLFYPDQLSPEYQKAQINIDAYKQSTIEERRNIFDPNLTEFMSICKAITSR